MDSLSCGPVDESVFSSVWPNVALCHCQSQPGNGSLNHDSNLGELQTELCEEWSRSERRRRSRSECGLVKYAAQLDQPMMGLPLHVGDVRYLQRATDDEEHRFEQATLALYINGFSISRHSQPEKEVKIAWSPFSLVQACRLHTVKADESLPWLRLFKISVFHHGSTHFFAVEGSDAEIERTRWVADIARVLRAFTQSLFPPFEVSVEPVVGVPGTGTRILAGYLLKCDKHDVTLVYGELHAHWEGRSVFVAYEDEYCDTRILKLFLEVETMVSEHVAVDCGCFTLDCHHFATRTCSEKSLWLRAISNIKVKLRHSAHNPTLDDIHHYRMAVLECARSMAGPGGADVHRTPLLPRRRLRPKASGGRPGENPDALSGLRAAAAARLKVAQEEAAAAEQAAAAATEAADTADGSAEAAADRTGDAGLQPKLANIIALGELPPVLAGDPAQGL